MLYIFGKPSTFSSTWCHPGRVIVFEKKWETVVLVCLVFIDFSKELLTSHCEYTESESLDPSIDFLAWFQIVCHRYASKKVHFTFSNNIWPLSLLSISGTHMNGWTETLSCKKLHTLKKINARVSRGPLALSSPVHVGPNTFRAFVFCFLELKKYWKVVFLLTHFLEPSF